jgi:hypothetical protein
MSAPIEGDRSPAPALLAGARDRTPYAGTLRQCGWVDCPGLAAGEPIRTHYWGYAHNLCRIAMDAQSTRQAEIDRAAILKLGEWMQQDRRRLIEKSTVRTLLGLDEEGS